MSEEASRLSLDEELLSGFSQAGDRSRVRAMLSGSADIVDGLRLYRFSTDALFRQ